MKSFKFITAIFVIFASANIFASVPLPLICDVNGQYIPLSSPSPNLITGQLTLREGTSAQVRAGFTPNPIRGQIIRIQLADGRTGRTVAAEIHGGFDTKVELIDMNGRGYILTCFPMAMR